MIRKPRVRLVAGRMDTACWLPLTRSGELTWPHSRHQTKLEDGAVRSTGRLLYEAVVRSVGKIEFLHHECLRPACVNPHHLMAVNHGEHSERHAEIGRGPSRAYLFGLTTDPRATVAGVPERSA